jgi:hypothetical protein
MPMLRRTLLCVALLPLAGCGHWWGCHPWWQKLTGQCCVRGEPVHAFPASQGHVIQGGPIVESGAGFGAEHGPIFAAPPGVDTLKPPPAQNLEAPPSQREAAPPPRPAPMGQPTLARPIPLRTAGQ